MVCGFVVSSQPAMNSDNWREIATIPVADNHKRYLLQITKSLLEIISKKKNFYLKSFIAGVKVIRTVSISFLSVSVRNFDHICSSFFS